MLLQFFLSYLHERTMGVVGCCARGSLSLCFTLLYCLPPPLPPIQFLDLGYRKRGNAWRMHSLPQIQFLNLCLSNSSSVTLWECDKELCWEQTEKIPSPCMWKIPEKQHSWLCSVPIGLRYNSVMSLHWQKTWWDIPTWWIGRHRQIVIPFNIAQLPHSLVMQNP